MPDDTRDRLTRKTPPAGVAAQLAAPVAIETETSEAYELEEERRKFRASRTDAERIFRLETKFDKQDAFNLKVAETLGELNGGMSKLVELNVEAAEARRATEARDLEAAKLRAAALEKASARRWALAKLIVLKVIVPIALAFAAMLGAYQLGGGK